MQGGEAAAHERLKYYLWDADLLQSYFQTRNGMLGGDYSTKFSPWLALGCISPRTIYHDIQKYQQKRVQNKSTYWVIFELTWRDFYKFFGLKYGTALFAEDGTSGQKLQWNSDGEVWPPRLHAHVHALLCERVKRRRFGVSLKCCNEHVPACAATGSMAASNLSLCGSS